MDKTVTLIQFHQYNTDIYWKTHISSSEYDILEKEIDMYNKWIYLLENGYAPLSSYEEEEDADGYLIAKHKIYTYIFDRPGNRGYYGSYEAIFNLINITNPGENSDEYDDIIETYESGEITTTHINELIDILIKKHGSDEFYMGYRILPMTQKLIDENRFN